jgi:hypothetical protein
VKGGRKVMNDDSNSSGKYTDENCDDNVKGDGDGDSHGNKVVQPKTHQRGWLRSRKGRWGSRGEFGHRVAVSTKTSCAKQYYGIWTGTEKY